MAHLFDKQIRVFTTETSAWKSMLLDINNATQSIVFEQFIFMSFEPGEIGNKFIVAIKNAVTRGVKVSLRLDAFGSMQLLKDRVLAKELRDAGIRLNFYQTMPLRNMTTPIRLFIRNHRKVLLIDNCISWIGGTIVGEEFRGWHDYTWRIDSAEFGYELDSELQKQYDRLVTGKKTIAPFSKLSSQIRLVGNSPGIGNRHVYEQVSEHILISKQAVFMVTPYFSPPLRLFRVLKEKLKEGGRIVLITPKKTDHALADWARWHYLWQLHRLGMEIYMCDFMNHAKIVSADNWVTFGSTNLDYLSLLFNHELNIDSQDPSQIAMVNQQIMTWLQNDYREMNRNELVKLRPAFWQRATGRILAFIT